MNLPPSPLRGVRGGCAPARGEVVSGTGGDSALWAVGRGDLCFARRSIAKGCTTGAPARPALQTADWSCPPPIPLSPAAGGELLAVLELSRSCCSPGDPARHCPHGPGWLAGVRGGLQLAGPPPHSGGAHTYGARWELQHIIY